MSRIRVHCPACGWDGARTEAGGPCPECETRVKATADPNRGHRIKWTLSVLEPTREALTAREAAEILDRAAKRRRA
ncbi:MAG: hypothetical protein ACPGVG_18945 [Mycobacterium sp.]